MRGWFKNVSSCRKKNAIGFFFFLEIGAIHVCGGLLHTTQISCKLGEKRLKTFKFEFHT